MSFYMYAVFCFDNHWTQRCNQSKCISISAAHDEFAHEISGEVVDEKFGHEGCIWMVFRKAFVQYEFARVFSSHPTYKNLCPICRIRRFFIGVNPFMAQWLSVAISFMTYVASKRFLTWKGSFSHFSTESIFYLLADFGRFSSWHFKIQYMYCGSCFGQKTFIITIFHEK